MYGAEVNLWDKFHAIQAIQIGILHPDSSSDQSQNLIDCSLAQDTPLYHVELVITQY